MRRRVVMAMAAHRVMMLRRMMTAATMRGRMMTVMVRRGGLVMVVRAGGGRQSDGQGRGGDERQRELFHGELPLVFRGDS
jgi:hypothetical protein